MGWFSKRRPTQQPSLHSDGTQELHLRNDASASAALEIMVEVTPDRYVLQPGDEMVIQADLDGAPFDITPYKGGLQIYPGNALDPIVRINGLLAKPDWLTPGPNSA
jgi:hypothetical protein